MHIEAKQLRYAVAAADHRSFRRAAEALHLKQSTLSRSIRQMEMRLGISLFERTRVGVRPTTAGAELLRSARRVLEELDTISAAAVAAGRGETGRLTIGFYTSLSAGNLRAMLVDYRHRYPQVETRIVQDSRVQLLAGVRSGSVDVAFITGDPNGRNGPTMALWSERILVALPEQHPLASHEIVGWSELKDETFLLGRDDPSQDFHDLLVAKLASPGDRPKVIQNDVSGETIKSLVGAGFGVSLLSDACAGTTHAGVVYREARDSNAPCRIGYMAQWDQDNDNPALISLLKLLQERYPPLPTGG